MGSLDCHAYLKRSLRAPPCSKILKLSHRRVSVMSSNRLRLNPSKTELIWLGSSRRLHHCSSTGMRVSDVDLRPVDCVRDLGVLIDSGMTLARHVNYISVFVSSSSDNCGSSVDPSPRTLLMLWYARSYTRVSTTATGFSFPVRAI